MNFRLKMLFAGVVLAALIGLLTWDQYKTTLEEKQKEEITHPFRMADGHLQQLILYNPQGTFILKRKGPTNWELTQKAQDNGEKATAALTSAEVFSGYVPANSLEVETILAYLSDITVEKIFDQGLLSSSVGLDHPKTWVKQIFKNNKEKTIFFGDAPTIGGKDEESGIFRPNAVFAKISGQPAVYLIDAFVPEEFSKKNFNDLRDRHLITLNADTVAGMQLTYAGHTWTLMRHAHQDQAQPSGWSFMKTGQPPQPADPEHALEIVSRYSQLEGEKIWERPQLPSLNWEKPTATVILYDNKNNKLATFLMHLNASGVYVSTQQGTAVVQLDAQSWPDLVPESDFFKLPSKK